MLVAADCGRLTGKPELIQLLRMASASPTIRQEQLREKTSVSLPHQGITAHADELTYRDLAQP